MQIFRNHHFSRQGAKHAKPLLYLFKYGDFDDLRLMSVVPLRSLRLGESICRMQAAPVT
jgi:hypothetical protein